MSDWPTLSSNQKTAGAFLNHSNGQVNTRLVESPTRGRAADLHNVVGGASLGMYSPLTNTVSRYGSVNQPDDINGFVVSHVGLTVNGFTPHAYVSGNSTLFDVIAENQYNKSYKQNQRSRVVKLTQSHSKQKVRNDEQTLYIGELTDGGYGSILNQIREVNKESNGEMEYLSKSFRIIRGTAVATLFLMLVLFFPLGMVILGVKYLNDCPKEPFVPIYLLVGGCFWMLKMFTVLWRQMRERKSSDSVDTIDGENQSDFITDRSTLFTDMLLSFFLLIWFGFGNYWTWRIFKPNFSIQLYEPTDWCERTVYMFSVIQILCCYATFAVFVCSVACLCCARHICFLTDRQLARTRSLRRDI